jgi:hypothetical protein
MAEAGEIAVLRIELQGIEPLVWRRVGVPLRMRLTDLHRVIQAAMGWLDCHLWEIEAGDRRYAMRVPSEPDWNEWYQDADSVALGTLADAGVRRLSYVYDMGDSWEHSIIVEKVAAPLPDVRYPQFLGGERRCPPEDCGGIPGYREFLENISSKQTKNRKAVLAWYGGPYDPDDIDETKIVAALSVIGKTGR